jgi:hypothetical protein
MLGLKLDRQTPPLNEVNRFLYLEKNTKSWRAAGTKNPSNKQNSLKLRPVFPDVVGSGSPHAVRGRLPIKGEFPKVIVFDNATVLSKC